MPTDVAGLVHQIVPLSFIVPLRLTDSGAFFHRWWRVLSPIVPLSFIVICALIVIPCSSSFRIHRHSRFHRHSAFIVIPAKAGIQACYLLPVAPGFSPSRG